MATKKPATETAAPNAAKRPARTFANNGERWQFYAANAVSGAITSIERLGSLTNRKTYDMTAADIAKAFAAIDSAAAEAKGALSRAADAPAGSTVKAKAPAFTFGK